MEPVDGKIESFKRQLGIAVDKTISGSEAIGKVIERIQEAGYRVFLVVEASIKIVQVREKPTQQSFVQSLDEKHDAVLNPEDIEFLKSARISIPDGEPR